MSPPGSKSQRAARRILSFAAVVETGTGLVLMLAPGLVAAWLLGADLSGVATALGRCFGIALLALGLGCWPGPQEGVSAPALRAMLTYNVLVALYLAYLGTAGPLGGALLWPASALHAAVGLLLLRVWRDERRTRASG